MRLKFFICQAVDLSTVLEAAHFASPGRAGPRSVLPHALLQQVLRRLDLPGGPHDGNDPLGRALGGLVDGDARLALKADLPDPLAPRADYSAGHLIRDCNLETEELVLLMQLSEVLPV